MAEAGREVVGPKAGEGCKNGHTQHGQHQACNEAAERHHEQVMARVGFGQKRYGSGA